MADTAAPEDREVYEKVLVAFYAARAHRRLRVDDFLDALLTPGERRSAAYLVYEYLQGRTPEFADFLRRALGYADAAQAEAALRAKYREALEGRMAWHAETGR